MHPWTLIPSHFWFKFATENSKYGQAGFQKKLKEIRVSLKSYLLWHLRTYVMGLVKIRKKLKITAQSKVSKSLLQQFTNKDTAAKKWFQTKPPIMLKNLLLKMLSWNKKKTSWSEMIAYYRWVIYMSLIRLLVILSHLSSYMEVFTSLRFKKNNVMIIHLKFSSI